MLGLAQKSSLKQCNKAGRRIEGTREEVAMPEYSISQLGKFEECALQYKFVYVDKIKRYHV
jgi:hypothetical protein